MTRCYPCSSPLFVLPQSDGYHPASASIAHSRSLAFIRSHLGGPIFDIEAIWEEHTYLEFEVRSVAKTMGTMVVCRSRMTLIRNIHEQPLRLNLMLTTSPL